MQRSFDLGFLIGTNRDRYGRLLIARLDEDEEKWIVEILGSEGLITYRFTVREQVEKFLFGAWPC